MSWHLSTNDYIYSNNNPVNLTDPSGLDPDCQSDPNTCALERAFKEILANRHGLDGLIQLFSDKELYTIWGSVAGRTVARRLDWVLSISRSTIPANPDLPAFLDHCDFGLNVQWNRLGEYVTDAHFGLRNGGYGFSSDEYFAAEFQDGSDQPSHFLTAVGLSRNFGEILGSIAIVSHERPGESNEEGLANTSSTDVIRFQAAVEFDALGQTEIRDSLLRGILLRESMFFARMPLRGSIEDLRLSVKGVRFSRWASGHYGLPAWYAAEWLHEELADPGYPPPKAWWR